MTAETRASLYKFLDRFGMPTVYLGVITYLAVMGASWTGQNVILPFIQSTIAVQREIAAAQRTLAESELRQTRIMELMQTEVQTVKATQTQHGMTLAELRTMFQRGLDAIEQAGL